MESQKTSTKGGRQSNPIDDEEVEELYMDYDDQCPNCKLYVINEFYVKDYDQKLFACRNCKAHFIGVSYYPTIEERSGYPLLFTDLSKTSTCFWGDKRLANL